MSRFNEYYMEFLGLNAENSLEIIVESEYRKLPLNNKYYYPIIVAEYNGVMTCSSSKKYFQICKEVFTGKVESVRNIVAALNRSEDKFKLRRMRRYTASDCDQLHKTKAKPITEDIMRSVIFNAAGDLDEYIEKKRDILEDRRQFAVIEKNQIASTAFISEIYSSGCNIVVYTNPEFRKKGYGKEVVKACLNWCQNKELVPVYLVEEDNFNSIKLVESLGLELKSKEWIISKKN